MASPIPGDPANCQPPSQLPDSRPASSKPVSRGLRDTLRSFPREHRQYLARSAWVMGDATSYGLTLALGEFSGGFGLSVWVETSSFRA